jgi:hypothetical protein
MAFRLLLPCCHGGNKEPMMLESKLFELADLIGLSQTDIAAHLGLNRAQVNRWVRAVRPVPQHYRTQLTDFIMAAVERRLEQLATLPLGLAEVAAPERSPREQLRRQILGLLRECHAAEAECAGEGPTTAIRGILEELERFKTLRPQELRKSANADALFRLAGALISSADLLRRISPVDELLRKEEESADDCRKPREPGAAGTADPSSE